MSRIAVVVGNKKRARSCPPDRVVGGKRMDH